ncbi:MAG: pitrilysin family protein [Pseudomonadota bacterium]
MLKFDDDATYRKSVLGNGLRIVTETMPYLKSVSMGIWVRSGSRHEDSRLNGICHFIEHMLFKGTERRSAYAIAREIDSVGGVLNAFTSKECTAFYCKVMAENLELAVDLLVDILLNASLPEDEIEREKLVVCQEIHQLEDSPEDLIHDLLFERLWKDDPLGRPIMGTIPNVMALTRETLIKFKEEAYVPAETVVCAAGDVDHDKFVELINRHMGRIPVRASRISTPAPPRTTASHHVVNRTLEQVHICMGVEGPGATDPRRYAGYVLNTIFGGGMSSRLFQEVREKRGLAYSVYSFMSSFSDTGLFGVYAGCDPARVEELLAVLRNETALLMTNITSDGISAAKNHLRGNIILSMESSEARMERLAKGEYFFGRYLPVPEVLEALDRVEMGDVEEMAGALLDSREFNLIALGPLETGDDTFRSFSPTYKKSFS